MNSDLIKQWLFVVIRYASPYVAGYLSTKFGLTTADAAAWLSTTVTILMAAWAMVNKARYETKVNTALDMPEGTDKATLKDVISAGEGAGALTKK